MADYPFTTFVLASTILVSWLAWQRPGWLEGLMLDTGAVLKHNEGYRVLSSGWIHADMAHLLFNMFSLWSFGSILEQVHGPQAVLAPHLAGIVGGSALALFLHRHEPYRALGASGGVCGVIFASVMLLPGGSVMIFPIPIAIPANLYAFAFLIVTWIGMRRGAGGIGHDAHFGGAIIGILTAAVLYPEAAASEATMLLAILAVAGGLFAISLRDRSKPPRPY